ncbi:hypothetical protein COCCU_02690 [Corynebacterium occultum]|uniref:Uncharacterized protein n=1 Tax=Corynebacterium occultum TaxID=2675219 RepID=A0A6B8VLY6_9CORY|nr:hypothetical protein [Corynebacterium occultum]QGU06492.1 hypothetical protein COCCU_02690 [Corynebacterium occultum]
MTTGFLVSPDLTSRIIEFELDQAAQFLGGVIDDRVSVAFSENNKTYVALFNAEAKVNAAEPNPVASLGRNEADTGNSAFISDPTRAISGPVIFVGSEGEDIALDEVNEIKDGIRAARNYIKDNEEDYRYWRAAVLNLGARQF